MSTPPSSEPREAATADPVEEATEAAAMDRRGSVVLIIPDELDAGALTELLAYLVQPAAAANRYLLRVVDDDTGARVAACWQSGCAVAVLTNVDIAPLKASGARLLRMPPGSTVEETDDLALAMSDACLKNGKRTPLLARSRQLGKPTVMRKCLLTPIQPASSEELDFGRHSLDERGLLAVFARQVGRVERLVTEVLAFWGALLQAVADSARKRPARYPSLCKTADGMRKALWPGWSEYHDFITGELASLCPDRAATLPSAATIVQFARLDATARAGARWHRDIIWIAYILSALAVCAALAGWVRLGGFPWGYVELTALIVILMLIVRAHQTRLQKRWMALRVAAEQLRGAMLCVPLFIAPRVLVTPDRSKEAKPLDIERRRITMAAITVVKRATRDQGLAALDLDYDAVKAAKWVSCFIEAQAQYHRDNHHTLEGVEHAVKAVNIGIFIAVVIAVALHVAHWAENSFIILLVTAAGPAIAAALHGASSRLNIVDRKELSEQSAKKLEALKADLDELLANTPPEAAAWPAVRQIARSAGLWMSTETDDWFKTMLLEEIALP